MALRRSPSEIADSNIRCLSTNDLSIITDFYSVAYPHNWFDRRMIETGKYFGYFNNSKLVGVSGIHVYSSQYKVAALGNIATHPDYRRQQIGFKLTSMLCNDLNKSVDFIGLNVKSDNNFALKCYNKLGFEIIGEYDECYIKNT
jgi:ribosomal protein S18 acetylase RimI-like enzyme